MHVGVFLDDISPDVGGGHTFIHSIASGLLKIAHLSSHKFTLFCPPQYARTRQGELPANVSIYSLAPRGVVGRGLSVLRHASPAFALAWRVPSRLARISNSLGIDLMWFLGGMHETLDVPYMTTVWDVQHLTHPWFPEVSAGGRWDYREAFLQRHLRRATRVITGTKIGRDELVHFYRLAGERIHILPHPTPDFALEALEIEGALDASLTTRLGVHGDYLLYPAQFWPHKNHVNLLRAMRLLHDQRASAPLLVLAGSDKGNRAYIEKCIADLKLTDKVRLLGFVALQDLVNLYRGARALVYPSFSGPENLPPLEAFALGCPVVCADYPGAREQLDNAAVYFDPGKPEAMVEAIQQVLDNDALRVQLIERGRVRAARWSGKDFVRGVFGLIDEFDAQRRCWA